MGGFFASVIETSPLSYTRAIAGTPKEREGGVNKL